MARFGRCARKLANGIQIGFEQLLFPETELRFPPENEIFAGHGIAVAMSLLRIPRLG